MSHGELAVKISGVTTTTSYPSLSVIVSLGSTSQATSKVRHTTGGEDWTTEVLTFDYDTDLHADTILVEVKGSRSVIETFTIDATSKTQTLKGENATVVIGTDFVVEVREGDQFFPKHESWTPFLGPVPSPLPLLTNYFYCSSLSPHPLPPFSTVLI